MLGELDIQKECQKHYVELVNALRATIVSQGNEIKNRDPNVTGKSLVLFSAIAKLVETARIILHIRNIDAADEMHVLLRSMLELAVNACYLQQADHEEIQRFFHFDPIAKFVAMNDLVRVSNGKLRVPQELEARITKLANDAHAASNLPLTERMTWSTTRTLMKRAKAVDDAVGDNDFAILMANMYVTGSGYVHATYKTLHRHANWITRSKEEHPVRIAFNSNNALNGVALVLINLGRYFNRKFDTPRQPFSEFARETERLTAAIGLDHRIHKEREAKK